MDLDVVGVFLQKPLNEFQAAFVALPIGNDRVIHVVPAPGRFLYLRLELAGGVDTLPQSAHHEEQQQQGDTHDPPHLGRVSDSVP